MDDVVIRAEGLGKRYQLGAAAPKERYTALRDVIAAAPARVLRGAARRLRGTDDAPKSEDFWALRDVNFEVRRGETLGIIGRNGAGKSTLLKVLSRITDPTEGRVTIAGRVASLLEVGTGFHPELTGRENIFLNGAVLGMSRAEIRRKFDEIVAFAEVEAFLDTPVKRYSSGMYVRLAFAVAAHLEPEILIVDEVLAVGDAEFQKKCLGKMSEVASGGRTVLFVSHNMSAVATLCSRSAVLDAGRLSTYSDTTTAISSYLRQLGAPDAGDQLQTRRPAWAAPWIRSVSLLDNGGAPRDIYAPGEPITVRMDFASEAGARLKRPVMGLILNHHARGVVGGVSTRMTGFECARSTYEKGVFQCTLPRLPLLAGEYSIDVWLGDGPEDIDTISSAKSFTLLIGNPYEAGAGPFHDLGAVFLDPVWRLSKE
jgi:lipopolysaccharide transport system ATP-binding protein